MQKSVLKWYSTQISVNIKMQTQETQSQTHWSITRLLEPIFLCHEWVSHYKSFRTERGSYFLAKEIFIGFVGVILKPWREFLAAPAWTSFSNSTNAMSCRPGTKRTSLKPANLSHTVGKKMSTNNVQCTMLMRKLLIGAETKTSCINTWVEPLSAAGLWI